MSASRVGVCIRLVPIIRKANLTWKEFSQKVVLARTEKDQTYYKYKTDYWRKGGGFPTPTGKLELFSTALESMGYDPLPYFQEPGESPYATPELAREYPLVLTSGYRQPFYFLSQYRNIPWLRSFQKDPIVQIHPETAKQYGIDDGDWAWIETPRGRIRQLARVIPGILPGVVMATANAFYPEEPAPLHGLTISNPNMLTSNDHCDPMYGAPDLTCLLCKIYPVEKKDMADLPKTAHRIESADADVGTVPLGQEGKKRKK